MPAHGEKAPRADELGFQKVGNNAGGGSRQRVVAAGGLLGAIAASSCCILPLVLFSIGASGAWLGSLSALAPYQPIFVGITLGFLGYGYYLVYRKPKGQCAQRAVCDRPRPSHSVKLSLWAATVLVAAALAFPYVAPMLLDL
ncbi:MAG: mercury transporter MerT [Gammaproteobacteria bacterium]|nr:mercury transporter MerT [Gammaproteobacteria bacterium]NIR88956.1 mercury transporter MerT [Gammaproteobacteria bacterium]NIU05245.1 mercury transporter MerT [Gammaproteobacteria bacterium]NIV52860.1 mercury transporter MerT [Gammaproteobacteria bacterium]NIW85156.1 mercury transporter MerT [Gammaproteobacteria bacterium]